MKYREIICSCGLRAKTASGAYLRKMREKKGVSLRMAAKAIPIHPSYLSRIEKEEKNCPLYVEKFYQAFFK